ncbi:pickpocket 23 short form [Nesidiocoris tenuis]|uniref:Pickpocket 23 short form n=1 Tax=Nesidiocoris tenuis TaxID=355587 RepID=A0ABN7AE21_9HEMI|nr:pickpocket 23 short form [Nesidiocoris tenuis]
MPDALRQRTKYGPYSLFKTSWKYQTREFFENSTLHGVRYVAEKARPIYEKLMWFSFVSIGAIVTLIIILSLWEKFQTNPTITGLDTDFHSWNVPFPGITLCLTTPYSMERFMEHVNRPGNNYSKETIQALQKFVKVMSRLSYNTLKYLKKYIDGDHINAYSKTNYRQLILELAFRCEDFMGNCTFKREEIPCCEAFRPTFTEHGLCFSFNTIHSEVDWPWKPPGLNTKMEKLHHIYETDSTWSIQFDADLDKINCTAFRIFIHDGNQLPGFDSTPQYEWDKQIDKLFFAARTTYTTANARQLSIKQRKCVFKDERKLVAAKEYSYWACMNDCRMKLAKERCLCVPFIVFAVPGFPHCDFEGMRCLAIHQDEIENATRCSCELGCDNTVYEVEKLSDSKRLGHNLEIGFVSWPMIRYKREVLFGWVDLLVAFGGIAGLFLGFSLLSGVEIIYYFTLRAACMVYRNKSELEELRYQEESLSAPRINLSLAPDFTAIADAPPESQPDDRTQQKAPEKSSFVNRVLVPGGGKKTYSKSGKYPMYTIPFLN